MVLQPVLLHASWIVYSLAAAKYMENKPVTFVVPCRRGGASPISGSLLKISELAPKSNVTDGFTGTASTTSAQIQTWLDEKGLKNEE